MGCEAAERATKSGEVCKSAFFESLLFIVFKTNSPRQSTDLLVEYAFSNSCPRLKRKKQAKAMSSCILEQLKFAFGSLSTQPNVTKILFWFAIEKKDIRVTYKQMNASVSAARGKLLAMDTTENVTKLMIYSGLQKQKNHQG